MKKVFLIASLVCYTSTAALAQHNHSSARLASKDQNMTHHTDTATKANLAGGQTQQQFSQLLSSYLNIKNALVTGDANSAAWNADQFLRTANTIDFKVISEGNLHILSNDAGKIADTKDLKKQRGYFANLSSNMTAVAESFKLSNKPVYVQYCPMKKASWLSMEKQIRNPYYGSSMLTCGEVTKTF